MEYICGVCAEKIKGDLVLFKDHTEKHIIDLVKKEHPHWVEKNGMCNNCMDYYKGEMKGMNSPISPYARKTGVLQKLKDMFTNLFKQA